MSRKTIRSSTKERHDKKNTSNIKHKHKWTGTMLRQDEQGDIIKHTRNAKLAGRKKYTAWEKGQHRTKKETDQEKSRHANKQNR